MKLVNNEEWNIIGIYCSPKIPKSHLYMALNNILGKYDGQTIIIPGDFNINWMNVAERQFLHNVTITMNSYEQQIST